MHGKLLQKFYLSSVDSKLLYCLGVWYAGTLLRKGRLCRGSLILPKKSLTAIPGCRCQILLSQKNQDHHRRPTAPPPHLNDPMPSGPGPTRSDSQTASSSWPGQQTNKPHQAMSHGLSNPHHSDHSHTDSTQTKPFQALCDVSSNVPFTLCAFFLFCIYSTCLYVLSLSVIYSCCPNIYIYSCTVCVEHPNFCCTMSIKAYSIVYTPLCI